MKLTIGWDIGGAHVKAAAFNYETNTVQLYQQACPLWKGLSYLIEAIQSILMNISCHSVKHIVTMTGELVDLFPNRTEGVKQIIVILKSQLLKNIWIYATEMNFIPIDQINLEDYSKIASMNWLASATWIAKTCHNGLFLDIGSTTTDILLINQGTVAWIGQTDAQRLSSQELVYSGVVRTAVMAISQQVFWRGQSSGLMCEYFATMADVYRLTGDLIEYHDQNDTADGSEKTMIASARRLARMLGQDIDADHLMEWQNIAQQLKYQQKNHIQSACLRQLSRNFNISHLIGAGIGQFLAKHIAQDLNMHYLSVNQLMNVQSLSTDLSIADIFPAFAVADLARFASYIND